MSFKRSRFAFVLLLLTGCAGLIGVPDLTLEEDPTSDGGAGDGSNLTDGQVLVDSAPGTDTGAPNPPVDGGVDADATIPIDTGADAATCDLGAVATDPNNCGRCGHSCQGGTCTAGLCDATKIGIHSAGGLRFLAEHGDNLYISTFWNSSSSAPGIFKLPKAGGTPVLFVDHRYTEQMSVVGDTLYFIINDYPYSVEDDDQGGVWSCDLNGPTPCVPKLEAFADSPNGLAVDNGTIYFRNFGFVDETIRAHAIDAGDPDASPVIGSTESVTYLYWLWAGQSDLYSLGTRAPTDNRHTYLSRYPVNGDGGPGTELSRYTNEVANPGGLTGTAGAVYFASYDFDTTTGGTVRRVARDGGADPSCTYGLGTERRPSGIHVDETNVYWTNQGDSASPYGNGSVAYCAAKGACCATPNVIWRGEGEPVAITGDDKFLYWIGYRSGDIFKVAKP